MVDGNFDQALTSCARSPSLPRHPGELGEPVPLEGQKTAAFEVVDQLGRAPDYHLSRRQRRQHHRLLAGLPRVPSRRTRPRAAAHGGFQAAGAAPIYENRVIDEPRTVATAIKIGNPASWGPALEALKDSRGWIDIVTDEEILQGYRLLAREEGIFMEPASAATVAGPDQERQGGALRGGLDARAHADRPRPQGSRHRAGVVVPAHDGSAGSSSRPRPARLLKRSSRTRTWLRVGVGVAISLALLVSPAVDGRSGGSLAPASEDPVGLDAGKRRAGSDRPGSEPGVELSLSPAPSPRRWCRP